MMLVAVQLSVPGLYLPPVPTSPIKGTNPPQTIISLSVHTAVCSSRASGALVILVAVQLSVPGLYLPPVSKCVAGSLCSRSNRCRDPLNNRGRSLASLEVNSEYPPQTIISLPVHTAVWLSRPVGALVVLVSVQLSVPGLYLPPVLKKEIAFHPPQTIISLPVQIAVCPSRPAGVLVVLVAVQLSVLGLYLPPVSK